MGKVSGAPEPPVQQPPAPPVSNSFDIKGQERKKAEEAKKLYDVNEHDDLPF